MTTKDITKQSVAAGIYVALSLVLAPISFSVGLLDFRLAEMLMILPFYDKKYIYGITIGCLITNLFSPMGIVDVICGTAATLLACIIISRLNNKFIVPIVVAAINGIIIPLELYFVLGLPFWLNVVSIFLSELVVVTLGGLIIKKRWCTNII